MQVETVELLADLEEEDSENEDSYQKVECNTQLNHHGHAIRGAGCSEEKAIFHRQEADHLRDSLAARDHHQEGEQNHSKCDSNGVPGDGCGEQTDWLCEAKGEDDQHQTHEHGDRNVDQALVIPLGSQPLDQRMKNQRQGDDLQDQRQCSGLGLTNHQKSGYLFRWS